MRGDSQLTSSKLQILLSFAASDDQRHPPRCGARNVVVAAAGRAGTGRRVLVVFGVGTVMMVRDRDAAAEPRHRRVAGVVMVVSGAATARRHGMRLLGAAMVCVCV